MSVSEEMGPTTFITPQYVDDCTSHVYQYYTICLEKKDLEEFKSMPVREKNKMKRLRNNTEDEKKEEA